MENETQESVPARSFFRSKMFLFGIVMVVVVAGGVGYYFRTKAAQDPQAAAKKEAEQLVAVVGKLMLLPTGETPVIATVADPSKLADQPFFAKAKKGDKVLIYNTARKAILYSPSDNRIIDVAPLSIGQSPSPSPSATPVKK